MNKFFCNCKSIRRKNLASNMRLILDFKIKCAEIAHLEIESVLIILEISCIPHVLCGSSKIVGLFLQY